MTVKKSNKTVTINPLKVSQTLGGVIALQGFYKAMPIIHGSQGCAAFAKSLMTQHFREPIALQTTALQEMTVIFGSEKNLIKALDTVIAKHDPPIIAVLSTALTDTAGEDIKGTIKEYQKIRKELNRLIVPISIPDFYGSLESGYSKAVEEIVTAVICQINENIPQKKINHRVNFLPGSHLTAGDVMEIKNILSAFGLEVITIPDISTSLAGSIVKGFSPLTRGGVTIEKLRKKMASSCMTIAVGASMEKAAQKIEEYAGVPYRLFPSLTGLKANDDFFTFCQSLSNQPTPIQYHWERDNLLDCMLDGHFYYSSSKVVLGLEPDHLYALYEFIKELGIEEVGLVSTYHSPILSKIESEVIIGDLMDLETMAQQADFWISNSHGKQGAKRKGIPFIALGFPIFNQIGSSLVTSVGYRGTTQLLLKIVNILIEESGEKKDDESSFCLR